MIAVVKSPVRSLSTSDIIKVWELGQNRPSWYRALLLLSAALPDWKSDEVAKLTVGDRNALLLSLREMMIGSTMDAYVECPKCADPLEFQLDVTDFCHEYCPEFQNATYTIQHDDLTLTYRLLDTTDLASSGTKGDVENVRMELVQRCIINLEKGGEKIPTVNLDHSIIELLSEQMSERDVLADKRVPLLCAACEHVWPATFDIVKYFWVELEVLAQNLLNDVLVLAKSFGWSQAEILSMTSTRRTYYLNAISD